MIFVGEGALLKNALIYTLKEDIKIDMVYSRSNLLESFLIQNNVPFIQTDNINDMVLAFESLCADKIVVSINNGLIFSERTLSLEKFRFYNIHNGILPFYRGRPEICIIFALLKGEKEYGASLHQIDRNIDSGQSFAMNKFPLSKNDDFQSVMTKSLECCHTLFTNNLNAIVQNTLVKLCSYDKFYKPYSYADLKNLSSYSQNPAFNKAINLGVYRLWFKELYDMVLLSHSRS
jgi:methionyl-tRNA formyltransferase